MDTEPSPGHGGESPTESAGAGEPVTPSGSARSEEPGSSGTSADGRRPVRRRRHRASVLAVAAAVLVAGGGGAWWASAAGDRGSAGAGGSGSAGSGSEAEPPELALDGLVAAGQSGKDGGGRPGIAPGEPHPRLFRADVKLPDGPGTASVYRSPAHVERASVAALAEALDVAGKPEKKDGRWVVDEGGKSPGGTAGGTALTVNDGRMTGNWTYHSGDDRPVLRCGKPLPTVPGSGPGSSSGFVPPEEDPGSQAPDRCPGMPGSGKGDPVSEKKAKSAVRPLLKTLKLNGARLDAGVTTGSLRMVTATPKIDGMPAKDWNSTFTVDEDGKVVRAHGNLGKLRRGATYPVMSAEDTLKQLNRQGSPGTAGVSEAQPHSKSPDPKGKVAPSKALKVTGAEFGLATRYTNGTPVLVPSWIYEVRLGGDHRVSVAHPAVEPEYLKPARPARPGPAPDPDPDPGSGSDSGSAPGSGPDSGTGSGSDSGRAGEAGAPPAQAAESFETDGRTLKVTFWGGVCGGYEASAEESGKRVEVTVRPKDTDPGKVCVKMAQRRTVEVKLDRALDGREVVDAADGDALPHK
ncbi:hypothetical protein HCC61_17765 [Streptomyces sp. HNM0575]|uniref:hypothetical protein n=1 Tax=Streptomyces sp. HNM0575 TaxID=2716338 RepID=UPI00145DED2E|nr:hypothetical protein [Streptomyces sp. HNM0575]NLU74502.1 hypothetical protein [Streptomyces sp. HNM0575]